MWQWDIIISSLQPSKVALTVILLYIVNKAITSPTNMGTEDGDRLADKLARTGQVTRLKWFVGLPLLTLIIWTLQREDHPLRNPWVPVEVVGIVMALVGWGLRLWAMRELGRFFTFEVGIRKGHSIVQSGPYRLLRHPSYTGLVLGILGLCLFYQVPKFHPYGMAVGFAALLALLTKRLRNEEDMLHKEFGKDWEAYAKRTWRLIPYIY